MRTGEIAFPTPMASVSLVSTWHQGQLVRLNFCSEGQPMNVAKLGGDVAALEQALANYFLDATLLPVFPVSLSDLSMHQAKVLMHLSTIPCGQVQTYGQVASLLGSSARAVGRACATNPFPILIPCHRVVAKSGVGGFIGQGAGHGVDIKRWLLAHEGVIYG